MVYCLGVPFGFGAKDNRTQLGPYHLIDDILEVFGQTTFLKTALNNEGYSYDQALEESYQLCKSLAAEVEKILITGQKPLVIGGDHSIAVGTWVGAKNFIKNKTLGLLWFDAHLDAHIYQTSPSKRLHGMPISVLLGYGDKKLQALSSHGACLDFSNLIYIGARSFESPERDFLEERAVKIYYMEDIQKRGLEEIVREAINTLEAQVDFLGISLDIDFFDPQDAPGTGTREKKGAHFQEFLPIVKTILKNPKTIAFEIAEYNPKKDKENLTKNLMVELLKVAQKSMGRSF
ncbi:MAG TPA: arginase [Alphaproteobacteria bacterium]|nr:arginase [Alphaproteobacteria bacterium]